MRVLIAGCGYVGSALAVVLERDGHEVFGLRRNVAALPEGITGIAGDLAEPAGLRAALAGLAFPWLVYAAAADGRDEAAYRRAYVDGLLHVLGALPAPERLLFTSSTAVYAQDRGELVDELSPTVPASFAGAVMLEAEAIVARAAPTPIVLRLGGIYGPGRTRLVEQVRRGLAELPPGPSFTNRIHRDDCAGAARHLLSLPEPASLYVGVDHEPADTSAVLRWLAQALGRPEPPPARGPAGSSGRGAGKRCSSARLRASGYAFRYPTFREGYAELLGGGPPSARAG